MMAGSQRCQASDHAEWRFCARRWPAFFRGSGRRRSGRPSEPDAALLLEIDRAYRQMADAGELPRIAPRRFNPTGEAWLPIWHTERGSWHFTAIYSNTARAHQLGRVRDWVVIYFQHDHGTESQRTVVTETRGPLTGRRVVRGRETECTDLPTSSTS